MRALIAAALFFGVLLAGCIGDDADPGPADPIDRDQIELQAGKGAIAGLLVDDRFRPIHLTEDPETEFDTTGFILLQETGEQVKTTENGEFVFVDLEPGTFTLRVQAAEHEAVPQKVSVVEGEFAEASVVARRASSAADVVLTQEHAAFASCFTNFVWLSVTLDCTGDGSGDTDRAAWYPDLSEFNGTLEYIVLEALFDNLAPESTAYDVVAREGAIGTDFTGGVLNREDGRYIRLHLPIGELSPDPVPEGSGCDASPVSPDDWCAYMPDKQLQIIIFGRGYLHQEIKDTYRPVNEAVVTYAPCSTVPVPSCLHEATMRRGAGGALATQATYMLSLFLYDPEEDGTVMHESDYCSLCPPAD